MTTSPDARIPSPRSPFLIPDSAHPFDIYTDAVVHLLADRGIDRLSVRAIARWMGVTPAAVLQRHSQAQIREIVVARFGWRWVEWSCPRRDSGLPARLPTSADECHGVRVWQALGEISRGAALAGHPAPQSRLEQARRDEAEAVAVSLTRLIRRRPDPRETAGVLALVSGLRAEIAAAGSVVTSDVAAGILRDHVERLRQDGGVPGQPVRSA
ncbi:hypothetical protein [Nocardioides caricicola]|uniref:TetR family transcriptional regulator n=1 Tax=Nocardioides caricicola TaxID=634770 RepID=A0ABW0MVT8_9ACTN